MNSRVIPPTVSGGGDPDFRRSFWLTSHRLILFVIGWLLLFAIGSIFVSNPFEAESSASATPDYARVMYLHGLLVGMVGLLALLTCRILSIRSYRVQAWIGGGVVLATIFSGLGGIWDRTIPGPALPLWSHLIGLFALDVILVVLLIGMIGQWRSSYGALPLMASALAVMAMEVAALMGHLAGWIMQYGWKSPTVIAAYAQAVGFGKQDDFTGALMGAHSHALTVGAMALAIALAAQQFGYPGFTGAARRVVQAGLSMVAAGTALMTVMYVVMGLTAWSPPAFFTSGPKGVNGIAGDDMATGVLIIGGGLVAVAGLALGRLGEQALGFLRPIRLAAVWAWVVSFAIVVVAGYAIEMHEAYFGAGDPKAPGAAQDAVFTWYHQDIGLFLLPTIVGVMLAIDRLQLVNRVSSFWIGGATLVGTTLIFLGGLIWVFVNPSLFGPGYAVATAGLAILGAALLAALWKGMFARATQDSRTRGIAA